MKMNSGGANGIVEYWLDGNLIGNASNIDYGGGNFSWFMCIENAFTVKAGSPDRYIDWDDLAISTTGYIGPLPTGPDTSPPSRSNPQPSGTLPAGTTSVNMNITTDEPATCRYSTTPGTAYPSMTSTFSGAGTTSHSTTVSGLQNGTAYNYYVRCNDTSGNYNPDDFNISFSVASPPATCASQGFYCC
ncbi:MAG: hypothetical protein MUP55_04180, partial [Candidatus Aenigmarchaeota archaeon]|nr:hypothetical protein [Candidatus Aenigmarchaeota archaeon]